MKITYGPLASNVTGKFGGAILSPWRGVRTVRRLPSRPNPSTPAQVEARQLFSNASRAWTSQRPYTRAAWQSGAAGRPYTARNLYLALQIAALSGQPDIALFVGTPGQPAAQPFAIFGVGNDVQKIYCWVTPPTPPLGWSVQRQCAIAIPDTDWRNSGVSVLQHEASSVLPTNFVLITGLTTGTLYRLRAWIIWNAPDGSTRHSISVERNGTPT